MQICLLCQSRQLDGVLFCSECGASLHEEGPRRESTVSLGSPPPPTVSHSAALRMLTLVVVSSGRRIAVDASDDLLVGRKDNARGIFPDIDLGLDDGYEAGVSRRHAIIAPAREGWNVEDLASANGTFVNGKRLAANTPTIARTGDELQFGTLQLRIE
jgi:hypothetical protein